MNWPSKCPRCRKPMTAHGWASEEGFICSHCIGKERKAKRRRKRKLENK